MTKSNNNWVDVDYGDVFFFKKNVRESSVEKALIRRVKEQGGIAYKFVSPNCIGVPDRLVLLPLPNALRKALAPYMFFAECKAPGKKAKKAQVKEHKRIRDLGYTVVLQDYILNPGIKK